MKKLIFFLISLSFSVSSCKLTNLYKVSDKNLEIKKIEIFAVPFSIMFSGKLLAYQLDEMYTYRTTIDKFNAKGYEIKDIQNRLDSITTNLNYDSLQLEDSSALYDIRLKFKLYFNNRKFIIGYISDLGYMYINYASFKPNYTMTNNIIYFLPEDYKPD